MERLKEFADEELAKVWLAAVTATGLSMTQINTGLTTIVLLGTVIYTWRKAIAPLPNGPRKHKRAKEDRERKAQRDKEDEDEIG